MTKAAHRLPLQGKVAWVAGATRGAGRAIALALGEAGATVYCSGRSSRGAALPATPGTEAAPGPAFVLAQRPETIEETAEGVTAAGGHGIAARADHTRPAEVEALAARIRAEQGGLDVLVNDVWGGDELAEWGRPFWEQPVDKTLALVERAVHTHLITARHAIPLMLGRPGGLLVEITDGDGLYYRGALVYDLVKIAVIRLAFGLAEELRPHGIAALSLTPGFLRSEAMLEHFGVTEANWREGARQDANFLASETPGYVGRAVVALASDPDLLARSGGLYSTWGLRGDYGLTDRDGARPDWGAHAARIGLAAEQAASQARFLAACAPGSAAPANPPRARAAATKHKRPSARAARKGAKSKLPE